jgi:tetratricopeptide (TPR) repeat protein
MGLPEWLEVGAHGATVMSLDAVKKVSEKDRDIITTIEKGSQKRARAAIRKATAAAHKTLLRKRLQIVDLPDTMVAELTSIATEVQAYNTLGVALALTGRVQEAADRIRRSIALAESHKLLQATCRGYTNLSVLLSSLDPPRSIETCLRGLEAAKKVGDLGFQSRLYANLAVAYCALTDRCEAEGVEAAQAAIDLDRRLGLLDHLAVPLIVLGQIHQCHGEFEKALRYYEEARGLAEEMGEPQLMFPCYDGLATVYLDQGDDARAEEYFVRADEVCAKAGVDRDSLVVLPFLC